MSQLMKQWFLTPFLSKVDLDSTLYYERQAYYVDIKIFTLSNATNGLQPRTIWFAISFQDIIL